MNVRCDECGSVFRVDPAKVPVGGVRARCSVCGGVMRVEASNGAGTMPDADPPSPAFAGAAAPSAREAAGQTAASPMHLAEPVGTHPVSEPSLESEAAAPDPAAMPARDRLAEAPSEQPPVAAGATPPVPPTAPTDVPAGGPAPAAPIWPSPSDVPALRHTPAADRSAIGGAARTTPSTGEATPPAPLGPRITPRVGPTVAPGGSAPRRPINPYLNADPQQKARRLARALVSDIVAYHPQKREEGLRTGALKQLFREEIKKSYEEYVEQVGRELADSTSHFQDALNDVLAGGRRIF